MICILDSCIIKIINFSRSFKIERELECFFFSFTWLEMKSYFK